MPSRRTFLKAAASAAAIQPAALPQTSPVPAEQAVLLMGDGLHLSPAGYAQLLVTLAGNAKPDTYLKGGAVEELENRFAKLLGKERGLFFPTGTLANYMAVRLLAGDRSAEEQILALLARARESLSRAPYQLTTT